MKNEHQVESVEKKPKYPKHVFLILANEFCEKYSNKGMAVIRALYLRNVLQFSEDTSTTILSLFLFFAMIFPLLGAILADSFLGKFKTILYLSIVYAIGDVVQTLGAIPLLNLPSVPMCLLGLALMAVGAGGIGSCIPAFCADQFELPTQAKQLSSFFAMYYFITNLGGFVAQLVTPILRKDVQCFGDMTCYSLAFGVPAIMMMISIVFFLAGRSWYTVTQPKKNIVLNVCRIIVHAISRRRKIKSKERREHWLDHADDKFGKTEIEDIKIVLRVLYIYLPLPIIWALFILEGTRWAYQATHLNGQFGPITVHPDQIGVVNSILVFIFIPLFDRVIYPICGKFGILVKPLRRIIVGFFLAALAFFMSGVLEMEIQETYAVKIGMNQGHLNIVNLSPVNLRGFLIDSKNDKIFPNFDLPEKFNYNHGLIPTGDLMLIIQRTDNLQQHSFSFGMSQGQASTILVTKMGENFEFTRPLENDFLDKSLEGNAHVRIVQFGLWTNSNDLDPNVIDLKGRKHLESFSYTPNSDLFATSTREVHLDSYDILVRNTLTSQVTQVDTIQVKQSGSYIIAIAKDEDGSLRSRVSVVTPPDIVHMAWIFPQYICVTAAQIMFAITLMEFSYNQAPASMKTVMQAMTMLTAAGGSLIVIFMAQVKIFNELWKEFMLYSGLLIIATIVFAWITRGFTPAQFDSQKIKNDEEEIELNDKKN